jgi:cyanophycinase-like exopeptidase
MQSTPSFWIRIARFAILVAAAPVGAGDLGGRESAYGYYVTGNAEDVVRPTSGFIALQGGGDDVDENYVRMGALGGGGDFVVLRASGTDEYDDYIYSLCHCDSVATLVIEDRSASEDPFVIATIRNAEALFIAGGDQSNYVRYWKDTPIEDAINFVAAKPAPIGGTSAGMAILGEFSYSAMGRESLTAAVALANPYDPEVTLDRNFLAMPALHGIITDQHLWERDRIGRTVALLARLVQDGWTADGRAIAADRETAVHIDPQTMTAEVHATRDHPTPYAYFMRTTSAPERCMPGQPLTFLNVSVYRIAPGGRFDLATWQGQGGIAYTLSAEDGVLRSSRGGAY